ncbi:hypothetical protein E8E14_011082 [Neopestalotiopsis sp. 37M]|nr:hypothetical protein E8E14_011082 [Neopestalotiopsis sp. 37M]
MSHFVSPDSAPKRIIICCDGTWQSATSGKKNVPSNVTRLARELARVGVDDKDRKWQQLVWYDSGVGTTSLMGRVSEGAVGSGLEVNVLEAYNFIALNWVPGDKVYCFGFSRGAFTARAIAGLVSDIGICEPRKLQHFPGLWEKYKEHNATKDGRFYGSKAYWEFIDGKVEEPLPKDLGYKDSNVKWKVKPTVEDWTYHSKDQKYHDESRDIEIVGVYDTVGALGMPSLRGVQVGSLVGLGPESYAFYNVALNRNIKRAYHALALDERREAFSPTLWQLHGKYPFDTLKKEHDNFETAFDQWHSASTNRKMPVKEKLQIKKAYNEAQRVLEAKETAELEKQEKKVEDYSVAWRNVRFDHNTPLTDRENAHKEYTDARMLMVKMKEYNKPPPELSQVWFPGVHINVGGGSSDSLDFKGDMEELSDITYSWMLDQIRPHLSIDWEKHEHYIRERDEQIRMLNFFASEEDVRLKAEAEERKKENYFQAGLRWAGTSVHAVKKTTADTYNSWWNKIEPEKPKNQTHFDFGWGTGSVIDSYTWTYVANGPSARTPHGYTQESGRTHESVHPVVGYRMYSSRKKHKDAETAANNEKDPVKKAELVKKCDALKKMIYNPIGLVNGEPITVRHLNPDSKQWEYIFHGKRPVPEYNMRPRDKSEVLSYEGLADADLPKHDRKWYTAKTQSYERDATHGDLDSMYYLKKLDELNGYKSYYPDPEDADDLNEWFKSGTLSSK